ncbi:RnfH family protein [Neisseriaceae bacterium B1]
MDNKLIHIELAYGNDKTQKLYRFRLPENTTAREAVLQSQVLQDFPEADLNAPIGIFGKRVKDETLLKNGDRIELYRPLIADPKEARRQRATPRKRHK